MSGAVIFLAERRPTPVPPVTSLPLCEATPVTLCTCGGLLAVQYGKFWEHVEACPECYSSSVRPCPARHRHTACDSPEPEVCGHNLCPNDVALDMPCGAGGAPHSCCGCCWERSDALEGRMLWPVT